MIDIGNHSYTFTDLPFFVSVGKYSSIAEGVDFIDPNTHLCTVNKKCVYTYNWDQPTNTDYKIIIGNDVWIGKGVSIIPPVTIGNGVIVGAYSVVAKDIPPYALVIGNPGRVKRYRFPKEQVTALEQIQWWNWPKITNDHIIEMQNVDSFIKKYEKTNTTTN